MAMIALLDNETVDKIAAGEVVERPSSVVKELVENAIDAKANAITVEIKEGGISFIRVTDNGCGIDKEQVKTAFLRHATSKIIKIEDLSNTTSLGFRGEALSSIAAVAQVELITKTEPQLTGVRYLISESENTLEDVGAPCGTTILVRNLFYNTPVRRKFLKSAVTEGGYVTDLLEHLALSMPNIAFKYIINNQTRFYTSGNGDIKEIIYRIYGKETAMNIIPVSVVLEGISINGYIGKPFVNRSTRSFEIYFINGRFVKSDVVQRAIEDAYSNYLMQHKFPFVVLHFAIDPQVIDVNVHPTKMDVRFSDGNYFYSIISTQIREILMSNELIQEVEIEKPRSIEVPSNLIENINSSNENNKESKSGENEDDVSGNKTILNVDNGKYTTKIPKANMLENMQKIPEPFEEKRISKVQELLQNNGSTKVLNEKNGTFGPDFEVGKVEDNNLFFSENPDIPHRILGQIFDTYWLISYGDKLFMIDQHAAHEKVNYERLIKKYRENRVDSQQLFPPLVVTLSGNESALLEEYRQAFSSLGFEIEAFGGSEVTIRSIPMELYGCNALSLFLEVLDQLAKSPLKGDLSVISDKIASMSCKAAVKGNQLLHIEEMETLFQELMKCENPYFCPHGRPTIISMSKYEIEKKFKRII